ncbi:hypothetical protein HHI36_022667 [Cryptolaemus montrouzieri]|uniref:Uncharacterized protein n=1 Tax=Cryptolaemus montrouzieri TaxID=559131 RepID=A0ABD2N0F7_9CUCU
MDSWMRRFSNIVSNSGNLRCMYDNTMSNLNNLLPAAPNYCKSAVFSGSTHMRPLSLRLRIWGHIIKDISTNSHSVLGLCLEELKSLLQEIDTYHQYSFLPICLEYCYMLIYVLLLC